MAETQGFKARVEYEVTDGTQLLYTFPFSYLRKKFIKVDVLHADNSITTLTYGVDYVVNDLSLTLTNPAKVGEHLIIYRQTTTDKIITWNDGSILLASDMNTEDVQMLHLQEEQQDYIQSHSINTKTDSATKEVLWDALNHRVINVSDPIDPQDAVTKHYMENVQGGFVEDNTKILNEAKATLSATQQTQSKAQTNEALSKAWATSTESPDNADDTQSSTGKTQSSRSWALYSKDKAQEVATKVEALRQLLDIKDDIARMSDFRYIARNTSYKSGLYLYTPSLGVGYIIYVLKEGTTSSEEPDWSSIASKVSGAMLDMGSYPSDLYEPDSWEGWGVSYVDGTATLLICRFDKMFSLLTRMYTRNYYMPKDPTFHLENFSGAGFLSNSGKKLYFNIPLSKRVHHSVSSVTVRITNLILRGDSKYYLGTASQGVDTGSVGLPTVSASVKDNWITITADINPPTTPPTNIVVGIACNISITFNS